MQAVVLEDSYLNKHFGVSLIINIYYIYYKCSEKVTKFKTIGRTTFERKTII